MVFRVLGSPLPCGSHASRRFTQYEVAADVLRAGSRVTYGQHILDIERRKTQPFPQSSPRGSLRTFKGERPAAAILELLGHMHGLQLGCPSSQLRSPFQGNTSWEKTLLNPKISLNLCSSMEPELGWRGSGPGWGSGAWSTAKDMPEGPAQVSLTLLPDDREVLGCLCGCPEVKVKTLRQFQTNHREAADCY